MQSAANRQAGDEIRQMRVDRGWTHEDMSREIFRRFGANFATSPRTIWRVESGHKPSVRKQFAIAQVLDVLPSQLWTTRSGARRTAAPSGDPVGGPQTQPGAVA